MAGSRHQRSKHVLGEALFKGQHFLRSGTPLCFFFASVVAKNLEPALAEGRVEKGACTEEEGGWEPGQLDRKV